ncbi:MAG TPA: endo-1,4-beta-glucanase [Bacillota bacterium]|nr:endo-1,4-beta-glucanase [Bacillota bacterium]
MQQICKNGDCLLREPYYFFNNLWGADTGQGSQSLWETPSEESSMAWGTSWEWAERPDSIKSYASIVRGWHWGWRVARTGLPVQLSSIQTAQTTWKFDLIEKTPGWVNVTYDLWFSDNPRLGNENPGGEMMIWLTHTEGIPPIGARKASAIIGGAEWELWAGPHPVCGWPVYSFVRKVNTNSDSLDLVDFFHYLTSHGLNSSDYLLSVQAGIEVFSGVGQLETRFYSLDIK